MFWEVINAWQFKCNLVVRASISKFSTQCFDIKVYCSIWVNYPQIEIITNIVKSIDHRIDTNHSLASPLNDQLDWVVAKALDGEVLPIVEHKVTRTGDDGLVLWILSLGVNLHCWSWIYYGNPFKFCKITNLRVQWIRTYTHNKNTLQSSIPNFIV